MKTFNPEKSLLEIFSELMARDTMGLDGLEDDAGHDRRLGDEGQVTGVDVGDVGARALGHEPQLCGRMTCSAVPVAARDGMVFQPGGLGGSVNVLGANCADDPRTWGCVAGVLRLA